MLSGRLLPLFCCPADPFLHLSPLECAVPSTIEICTILVQITPLDSALTDTLPVTPLESAVPKKGGRGTQTCTDRETADKASSGHLHHPQTLPNSLKRFMGRLVK